MGENMKKYAIILRKKYGEAVRKKWNNLKSPFNRELSKKILLLLYKIGLICLGKYSKVRERILEEMENNLTEEEFKNKTRFKKLYISP